MDDGRGAPRDDVAVPGTDVPVGSGAGAAWGRDVPRPPVRHRPWSAVLLVLHAIAAVFGAAVLAIGVYAFVGDLRAPSPEEGGSPDAWGVFLGVLFGVAGVGVLVPATTLGILTGRGRRAADQGSPGTLRGVAISTLVLAGIAFMLCLTAGDPGMPLVWLVLAGPFVVAAIVLLARMRSPHAQPTARPIGENDR